jgi:hypothetical protein
VKIHIGINIKGFGAYFSIKPKGVIGDVLVDNTGNTIVDASGNALVAP